MVLLVGSSWANFRASEDHSKAGILQAAKPVLKAVPLDLAYKEKIEEFWDNVSPLLSTALV